MAQPILRNILLTLSVVLFLTAGNQAQALGPASGALLAKLDCPDRVKDVAFSPDGKLLVAGYGWNDQGGARIWNVADRSVVATLATGKEDAANIECVAFSNDGKLFAAGNWNGDVLLWTVGSWSSHKRLLANRGSAKSLSFSPNSAKLVFSSEETVILYDLKTANALTVATTTDERGSFISASFSPNGESVIICRNNAVQLWDIASKKLIKTWKPSGYGFFGNVSPDGNYVIAGGGAIYGKKSVDIWKVKDDKPIGQLSGFRSGLFALAVSHSEKLFAVAGGDYGSGGDLSLWNLSEAKEIGYVSFGEFPIQALAFSPDDSILAAGSDDAFVLLYAVDRIRGPEVKKQDYPLCGEILNEGNKVFVTPLSKVPGGVRGSFDYAWKLEVANAESVADLAGSPVALRDWNVESSAAEDRVRVNRFQKLQARAALPREASNHIVFGDIQNPGWNEGFVAKIYGDGTFVVSNNPGRCLAYGSLVQLKTDFETVKTRLVGEGLLAVAKEPLTISAAHFRTRFIELMLSSVPELRTDADNIEVLLKSSTSKKREAFSRLFSQEETFMNSLIRAGMKSPPN
jgi:WD40 repeat protein